MKEIDIMDTMLREAHQCLRATRMTTAQMLPVLKSMGGTGFTRICSMGAVQFDACVQSVVHQTGEPPLWTALSGARL
jgi:oxaloacetate decarboxylase alpha subunit